MTLCSLRIDFVKQLGFICINSLFTKDNLSLESFTEVNLPVLTEGAVVKPCSSFFICKGPLMMSLFEFQGISKGLVADRIFTSMARRGNPADFVLCIGDDRSNEDMFEIVGNLTGGTLASNNSVFACTVGQKPSKAKYFLDDSAGVILMLQSLADASDPPSSAEVDSP